ncbi:MAG TPA: hypothetical protein PKA12_15260 [Saprospiraceae bacterium]|nr:hypothetical protein [Saprospiraceae bacterium]
MSFIIVDSGSTKADWIWTNGVESESFTTQGINPTTGSGLEQKLPENLVDLIYKSKEVFFYAAGGTGSLARLNMQKMFGKLGQGQEHKIHVESDMLGAARAASGDGPAIIGILGTGSNSCLFDGKEITDQIPSLGYLLSDEGSGNHLGRLILKSWFYRQMSTADASLFSNRFHLTRDVVLQHIYANEGVAAWLAGFSVFLDECSIALRTKILHEAFGDFVKTRIVQYEGFRTFDLCFVGSIAGIYIKELTEVCSQHELSITRVVNKPIDSLLKFHISREKL